MYGQNAKNQCSQAASCADVAPRPPQTLDGLIKDCVSFVQQINDTRVLASDVRDRLCGSRPGDGATTPDRPMNGQLDALEQFQGDAWRALHELRDHLGAIQMALG